MVAEHRRSMAVIEMAESLQRVGEQLSELSVEERNLLSVAYGSTAGSRRVAWRIITGVEQKENFKGMEQQASHARKYVAKVEGDSRGSVMAFLHSWREPHSLGKHRRVRGVIPDPRGPDCSEDLRDSQAAIR